MKKAILTVMVLILMLSLLPSCAAGVSQEDYDRVSSDLAAAQTEIQSLQGELSAKETELSAKEGELAAAQTQIQSLQNELPAKDTELEATKERLKQARLRIEVLSAIFIPAMTGELDRMTEAEAISLFFECRDNIKDVGDPLLEAKFEVIIGPASEEGMTDFFIYLLESTADALE